MFTKYSEIENHYHSKNMNRFLDYHPNLENEYFYIEEKIDGANISIMIDGGYNVKWAKRSGVLGQNNNFMGLLEIKDEYQKFIVALTEMKDPHSTIQIYGEIFGPGIQNRCNYGNKKKIKFYDMKIVNDNRVYYLTPYEFREMMQGLGYSHLMVKTLDTIKGLNNTLEFDPYIKNEYSSLIEGIVIKPAYSNYYLPSGSRFVLKKKNEEFDEKSQKKKKNKQPKEVDSVEEELKERFLCYINHNRLKSTFSKEGKIEAPEQIGNYIKLVMKDVKNDFEKENDLNNIERSKLNNIFKTANKEVVKLLKEYL